MAGIVLVLQLPIATKRYLGNTSWNIRVEALSHVKDATGLCATPPYQVWHLCVVDRAGVPG